MTVNIMKQYTDITRRQIASYFKLVYGSKYEKAYCEAYTKTYINLRYINFYDDNTNTTVRKNILDKLKDTQDDLVISNISDRDTIEQMRIFFNYVLYFDDVVHYKDLYNIIGKIEKLRKRVLKKEEANFKDKLYNNMLDFIEEKHKLISKFDTDVFYLKITHYEDNQNVNRVNLKYNIKFPEEYSSYAVERAFTQGIINEDRLFVEYYLVTVHVIKDILKSNFKRHYVMEFNNKLFKKPRKLEKLLNIIDYDVIKEKVSLKIRYEYFLENRQAIYGLMQDGYKFVIILDNSFEINYKNIEDLNMFEYVIINRNIKNYEELMKYRKEINNVLQV